MWHADGCCTDVSMLTNNELQEGDAGQSSGGVVHMRHADGCCTDVSPNSRENLAFGRLLDIGTPFCSIDSVKPGCRVIADTGEVAVKALQELASCKLIRCMHRKM